MSTEGLQSESAVGWGNAGGHRSRPQLTVLEAVRANVPLPSMSALTCANWVRPD
jgi:hypothetical protein